MAANEAQIAKTSASEKPRTFIAWILRPHDWIASFTSFDSRRCITNRFGSVNFSNIRSFLQLHTHDNRCDIWGKKKNLEQLRKDQQWWVTGQNYNRIHQNNKKINTMNPTSSTQSYTINNISCTSLISWSSKLAIVKIISKNWVSNMFHDDKDKNTENAHIAHTTVKFKCPHTITDSLLNTGGWFGIVVKTHFVTSTKSS